MTQTSPSEDWAPCTGCSCSNHHTPSFDIQDEDMLSYGGDFTRLMNSNEPPAPGEARALQSMLSKAERRIALLERHIQHIDEMTERQRAVRESMAEESQRMRDLVRVKRAPLSAIRRLPAEVLTEIFHHTTEITPPKHWMSGPANEPSHWEFHHKESPLWSIELVSRRWRDALLSHGKLWSNIIIQDVSRFRSKTPRELTRFALHLQRSRQYPLSLSLHCPINADSGDSIPGELFAFLVMASSRIETLHLYLRPSMLASFEPLKSAFRSLRTLIVLPNEFTNYPQLEAFQHAKNLRHVELWDVEMPLDEFVLPWDQITVYKNVNWGIGRQFGPPYEDTTALLSKMTRIVEFEISYLCDFCRREAPGPSVSVPVTCPQLASLKLSVAKTSASIVLDVLLNDLILPSLSSLDIDCQETEINAYNEGEQLFPAVLGLLRRSRCSLRELRFKHALVDANDLLEVFRISPSLSCLQLINVGMDVITDDILVRLTLSSDSESESDTDSGSTRGAGGKEQGEKDEPEILVPYLNTFHLVTDASFENDTFVQMVLSRWREWSTSAVGNSDRMGCLQSVKLGWVGWDPVYDPDDVNEILSYLEPSRPEGCQLKVYFGTSDELLQEYVHDGWM
ncbi:hypothetical protein IW261DRAFT_625920 [Armillaria novae-zelandiae]|uniref:F-box domain-containing protein n=1 Tax=Armillaria novae-zelandiae TaxID=153914 RepID=A0AA39PPD1_9AGAR|nr:hypothetical protein IW261DRAFT_625920 [Armillaria novae-zelandiae]